MNFIPTIHIHNPLLANSGNTEKFMEWTNDDALELIEQYRSHTELWNRSDPKYKDKLCRFRAWSEIAERFGCSKAEVERKMNVLLTQYRREKHKMLVKLYQGIQPNPSKWYAFKRFDFMEAGGGSSANSSSSLVGMGASTSNGHASSSSAAAAAAALNGVLAGFESSAAAAAATVAAASSVPSSSSHHRRMKSKEMKYFGAMGLNLLLANSQNMDTWNTVGQFSPPIGERGQLRVPLPLPFPPNSSSGHSSEPCGSSTSTSRNIFASSNSDLTTASPQKPMDTGETDDKDDQQQQQPKREMHTPSSSIREDSGGVLGGAGSSNGAGRNGGDAGSSPIPNTNTHEHLHSVAAASQRQQDQEDLDIKQELVDYFHAPHPPAPPDSHRSYSSTDENRLGGMGAGGVDSDDYAQDLRISAAAAAAAKNMDFSQFVLPRNLRRSSDSLEEKFSPLNMRKLGSSSVSNATASAAGQMLMSSLLSNESMSEDTPSPSVRHKSGSQDTASNSAAAAAAALYAESLNKDDCDFIGSNVTHKLRSMDRTQRIIAEKLISEVLFYGQFNELERSARIQPK